MADQFFIIGDPVSHSISPCIHNALFSHFHLEGRYTALHIPAGEVAPFFESFPDRYRGGNVTVPHKVDVLPFMNSLGEEAECIGAVNTVTVGENGTLKGDNTDCKGFIESVREEGDGAIPGPVSLLGAGGAARGILYGLIRSGVEEIFLLNRTLEKAVDLSKEMGRIDKGVKIHPLPMEGEDFSGSLSESRMVVNSTSLGMGKEFFGFPFNAVKKKAMVVDIVYKKKGTYLIREGNKRGIRCVSGLPMLASQAAHSFYLWTGILPGYDLVKKIALRCMEKGMT